jgi:uncharacterized protein involved in outer membrane biogenesis
MSTIPQEQDSTPAPTTPPVPPRHRRWRRWAIALAVCVALYAALGFWAAPRLIEHYVPVYAQDVLKRKAQLGRVRVNPFLLTVEAKDFKLEEADGAPVAALGRLFVDLELKSLLRWAWTFAQIRLEQPALDLILGADGSLNLARLVDDLAGPAPVTAEPPAPPPRAILQRIVVSGGRISLTDRSAGTPARVDVTPLDVELNDISTLPGRKGPYRLRATLPGGGVAEWDGEISLRPIASSGQLRAKGVKLATAWTLLRERLALDEPAGTLDIALAYQAGYGRDGLQLKVDPLKLQLDGLRLVFAGAAEPNLALESVLLEGAHFDLATRELVIPALSVQGGHVAIGVDRQGLLDWQKIVRQGPADRAQNVAKASTTTAASVERAPWKLRIDAATVDSVGLRYRDASRAAASEVNAASAGLRFALAAQLGGSTEPAVTLSALNVELSGVTGGAAGDAPLLRFERVALEDASIDVGARTIRFPRVAVRGGATQIVRGADGSLRGINVLDPADEGKVQREVIAAGRRAAEEGRPWAFSLERLALEQFHASYQDETTQPPLALGIKDFTAELRDISNDPKAVMSYDAKLVLAQEGRVTAAGRFALAGDSADVRVALERISIQPLAPLVAKLTVLRLESGDVSGQAQVTFRKKGERPIVDVAGDATVARLLLKEADSGERFLSWGAFEAKGLRYSSEPARIDVREVLLREPGAKIVVFKDRSVNLAKVRKGGAAQPAPASGAPEMSSANATAVSVGSVRIMNGAVDFADLSLVLPFATKVHKLQGAASRISSDPKSRTTLKFEGGVGQFGDVRVQGRLAPFEPKTFTDLDVTFRNVEMATLSPYTATFAGRKIAAGRLDLGLQYKIENDALKGNNTILLRDFTLGEQVSSPDAKDLPLDLAVALLQDSEGRIDLAVPVEGNVDNPEFSIGGVVMSAIGNVLGKLVSAPFRVLGAALGGGGDGPVDAVSFDAGRGVLVPPEREKLKKLAAALAKRPQLQLIVHAGVDPVADGSALNERVLRAALANRLGVTRQPDEDPGPVAYGDAKTQRALEAIAAERGGEGAVASFQAKFEKSAGRPAKRVNPALALVGQGSDDEAFYRALFEDLVRAAPRQEAGLARLAEQRGVELKRQLTEGTALGDARVRLGETETRSATAGGVSSRLELGALPQSQ